MWQEVAKLDDIAAGGMKYVRAADRGDLPRATYDGERLRREPPLRPRERAARPGRARGLDPHLPAARRPVRHPHRQVNLSWPIDHDMGDEAAIPEPVQRWFKLEKRLQWKTRVHDLHTYAVRVRDGAIEVDVPEGA